MELFDFRVARVFSNIRCNCHFWGGNNLCIEVVDWCPQGRFLIGNDVLNWCPYIGGMLKFSLLFNKFILFVVNCCDDLFVTIWTVHFILVFVVLVILVFTYCSGVLFFFCGFMSYDFYLINISNGPYLVG